MQTKTAEYQIISGNAPFLISSPHEYCHKRPNLTGVYKQGEKYTNRICKDLCKESQSSGILITKDIDYDPNYFKKNRNPYKKEVEKIAKENKCKMFLDIHGLNPSHEYDIGIYYLSRFSKSKNMARELRDILNSGALKGISIHIFRIPDNGQETLTEFVASKLRIPALQIEIAQYIREDEDLRNSLVKNICNFLNSY
jgi:hypothetical protein